MIKSQFSYRPLIWMFSSKKSNNLINRIHERSIRIVSSDNESNFENLLEKNKEISAKKRREDTVSGIVSAVSCIMNSALSISLSEFSFEMIFFVGRKQYFIR